jgi:hypothetical protein
MTKEKELALTLWYVYECIYTCNLNLTKFSGGERLLLDLRQLLNFRPIGTTLYDIEEEFQTKFNLTLNEYWKFKDSNHPLRLDAYHTLFPGSIFEKKEIDPNAKHVSNIAGITGKGDLSKKAHYRALSPDLNKDTALAFTFGRAKHGVDNFRKMTPEASGEIYDALMRHLEAFRIGEVKADDSKIHHLAHACANLHMLYRLCMIHSNQEVLKVISGGDIKNES